jgi:signal transduction histidine kinase
MKGLLARLTPDSLAARFVLLLAGALIAANIAALLVLASEGRRFDRFAQNAREVERIVTLASALESVEPRFWKAMTRAASSRFIEANVQGKPIANPDEGQIRRNKRVDDLKAALQDALPDRTINVAVLPRFAFGESTFDQDKEAAPDKKGGMAALVISVALKTPNGQNDKWLNLISIEAARNAGIGLQALLTGLGLSLVSVLGVGLLFVRRLIRPLSALAEAANAAGRGDRSARVPVVGAKEFRAAGAAFNDMQSKIAGFDAERMRTLGAVGHDLRTPITGLRIRAEMLEDKETRDAFVRTLDDMTVMADGLVTYAKGTREAEEKTVIELAPFLKQLCETRGAVFAGGADTKINARPVALGRAIGNVVDNAVRYAGEANVRLESSNSEARIFIEDDGHGIPPEKMETVFEPFVRGEDSRNSETGGAGLGLSIACSIVQAHGGTITLENKTPKGLRVTIVLPTP